MNLSNLKRAGLCPFFFNQVENKTFKLARISHEYRDTYIAISEDGELQCRIVGKKYASLAHKNLLPAVGDWVLINHNPMASFSSIEIVLERKNSISKAANVDIAFIVVPLDLEINLRRIERFLTLILAAKVKPVFLLSKGDDFRGDVDEQIEELQNILGEYEIFVLSAMSGLGMSQIDQYLNDFQTSIFLGTSGAGKSTLINAILGEDTQATQEVRSGDKKGRHTTVSRSLHLAPNHGIIIDTPGIRGLSLSVESEDVQMSFSDITALASMCKFSDCSHSNEPDCHIQLALERDELNPKRFESFNKLLKEASRFEIKSNRVLREQEITTWKKVSKNSRKLRNFKNQ
jgi:ribosome biogenesis GTPase